MLIAQGGLPLSSTDHKTKTLSFVAVKLDTTWSTLCTTHQSKLSNNSSQEDPDEHHGKQLIANAVNWFYTDTTQKVINSHSYIYIYIYIKPMNLNCPTGQEGQHMQKQWLKRKQTGKNLFIYHQQMKWEFFQ